MSNMQSYFFEIVDRLQAELRGQEVLLCNFAGEQSDFVRVNQSKVRQAGHVGQSGISLCLVDGKRQAASDVTLTGDEDSDRLRAAEALAALRDLLPQLPDDPHLSYAQDVESSEQIGVDRLPSSDDALASILDAGQGRDLVGIYAAGGIYRGFANSLGQKNWFASHTFNFDWSFHHQGDRAVKSGYAGFVWDAGAFASRVAKAAQHLEVLRRKAHDVKPGQHRVYLAPAAICEILALLSWGSFGEKSHRTKQTPLIKMITEEARLSPKLTLSENSAEGVAANFDQHGFIKPARTTLIDQGAYADCLVSARSAAEYGETPNGASAAEMPESLDVAAGDLAEERVLSELDRGIYIGNLWYLNYSDRKDCRMTGMTRFATFWVEDGKLVAPLSVMRFDDSLYRIFGSELLAVTAERELVFDPESYGHRSVGSVQVPGVLLRELEFTL